MFLNSFFYFALKFRSNILTLNSIKRNPRFYTTILIHLYTKSPFFQPADNERLRGRGESIDEARAVLGGLFAVVLAVATALHDLTTSTLAAIVVDRFALRARLVLKAFEPRVDVAKFDELGATFHEETVHLLVRNIESTDYAVARSNETVGRVREVFAVMGQRLGGPRIDAHVKGGILVDND
jgi:hypothetical protein